MTDRYFNKHRSQYDAGNSQRTRSEGCTWTSAANGIDAATGGKHKYQPDSILGLIPRQDETDPATDGWSLYDVDHAMAKIGVPFQVRTGQGWSGVQTARAKGQYVLLQGDSDRFPGTSCSGAFNGDHCIGVHPDNDVSGHWRIDDPICGSARYETQATLRAYAAKLLPLIRFGVFTDPVPLVLPDTATEDGMKFDNEGPIIGVATMVDDWPLWRVRDDSRTAKFVKGTIWQVRGVVRYHKSAAKPDGYVGFLVDHGNEAHILPRDQVSTARLVGST